MAEYTGIIPSWEECRSLNGEAGEMQFYCSWGGAITYEGEWILPAHCGVKSVTLSIAPWAYGLDKDGKPRVNFYGAVRKYKVTPSNAHKIPLLVKLVQDKSGHIPFSMRELKE